ncbi:hypothetical protein [Streptomyces abikoensis]|uniref:hypothetical protein n=1 Tax=Streptomyces abikoensis TaxID=97398 RepID=UPI00340E3D70
MGCPCEVVAATNGVPLPRPGIARRLVQLDVDGVSRQRGRSPRHPSTAVPVRATARSLDGIRTLLSERGSGPGPRVGIYTVVMRDRPQEITDIAHLTSGVGVGGIPPCCHRPPWAEAGRCVVTAMENRPQMLAEEFERIAAAAEREGVRLEFIHGKLGVKAVPDGDHGEIIRWLMERCLQHRPDLWLYPERGLRIETYLEGHVKPDGTLAVRESCETLVYSEPDDHAYAQLTRRPFGKTITLPEPVGFSLDTEALKDWVH